MSAPFQDLQANKGLQEYLLTSAMLWTTNTGRLYVAEKNGVQWPVSMFEVHERTFTQTTGDGVYTATVTIPAGYSVMDIAVGSTVVWNGSTATLSIGDADSATGYASSIDLKTSPVANTAGGYGMRILDLNGTCKYGKYYAAAGLVTITVTQTGTGTTGRTRVNVITSRGARTVAAGTKV